MRAARLAGWLAPCLGVLLAAGLAGAQSVRLRWYTSPVDGQDQPYAVVPPRGQAPGPLGLVVGLHGHYGGPGGYCALILGGAAPPPDFVVACPYGYGDTAFRFIGEDDLFEVVARVRQEFPIDPERIFVTGASDGGVAAYELALHHPDLFAGAMPLAAYGGMTQFPSIGRSGHSPTEAALIRALAATSWADNALHLPFLVANGARDFWKPLPEETVAHHLRRLGYSVEDRLHEDLAHDTWTRTYAGGAAFEWFRRLRRPSAPERVVFVTSDPRYRRAFWVSELVLRAPFEEFGRIEARASPGRVFVQTSGLVGFSVEPPRAAGAPLVELLVDGALFPARPGLRVFSRSAQGTWQEGSARPPPEGTLSKGPGLAGPLQDFRSKPVVFVHGSGPGAAGLEELARGERDHWTRGIRVHYPLRADREVGPEERATRTLVILGSAEHNRLARELEPRLPVRTSPDGRAVLVGSRRFEGPGVGYRVIYPSPWATGQYVVLVGGTDLAGIEVASLLPELQPDWVVAGPRARSADGRRGMVLGEGREVLASGFFDRSWRLQGAAGGPALEEEGEGGDAGGPALEEEGEGGDAGGPALEEEAAGARRSRRRPPGPAGWSPWPPRPSGGRRKRRQRQRAAAQPGSSSPCPKQPWSRMPSRSRTGSTSRPCRPRIRRILPLP